MRTALELLVAEDELDLESVVILQLSAPR